jgi:ribosomal protein L20
MRVAILGPGESGKGEVCRILEEISGLKATETSAFAARLLWGLKEAELLTLPCDYASCEEFYADRRNHRQWWSDRIVELNRPTGVKMYSLMTDYAFIAGIRRLSEITRCQDYGLVSHFVWVHRDVPPDPTLDFDWSRRKYHKSKYAKPHFRRLWISHIHNDGTLEDLRRKVQRWWKERGSNFK